MFWHSTLIRPSFDIDRLLVVLSLLLLLLLLLLCCGVVLLLVWCLWLLLCCGVVVVVVLLVLAQRLIHNATISPLCQRLSSSNLLEAHNGS